MRRTETAAAELIDFRRSFHQCLSPWGDALFELCDAALCSPAPVGSVPSLSLEPVFRAIPRQPLQGPGPRRASTTNGSASCWWPPAGELAAGVRRRRLDLGPL